MQNLETKTESLFKRLKENVFNRFDCRTAGLAALFMGSWVYEVNYHHGHNEALVASLKEAVKVFITGTPAFGINRYFMGRKKNLIIDLVLGILIPTIITTSITFLVHNYIRGTADPIASTMPTLYFSPPGFILVGFLERYNIRPIKHIKNAVHYIKSHCYSKYND